MSDTHFRLSLHVEWHPHLRQYTARVQVQRPVEGDRHGAPAELELFNFFLPDGTVDAELPGIAIVGDTAAAIMRQVLDLDQS